jgi:hypothetical protein
VTTSFSGQMAVADASDSAVQAILMENIYGTTEVRRASANEDRRGTDWWVDVVGRDTPISVDAKIMTTDLAPKGMDHLPLETWSVVDEVPGWTRDPRKRTDFVLWYWVDTGRWCLVPFPPLCAMFAEYWKVMREQYNTATQETGDMDNGGWRSECVFVPRTTVWKLIYARFNASQDN